MPGGHRRRRRRRRHRVPETPAQECCSSSSPGGRAEETPRQHTEEDALASVKCCLFSMLYLYSAYNVLISPYAQPRWLLCFLLLAQIHILVHGRGVLSLEPHKKLYYTNQAGKPPLLCWQKCKVHLLVDQFLFFHLFFRPLSGAPHTCREGKSRSRGGPAAGSPLGAPCPHRPLPPGAGRASPGSDLQRDLQDGDVTERQRQLATKLPDLL